MKIISAIMFLIGALLFMSTAAIMSGIPGAFFALGLVLMLCAVIGVCEKE